MVITSSVGRIIVHRISKGSDLIKEIRGIAEKLNITGGAILLIGALENAVFGFYEKGEYKKIEVKGPLEIISCVGNVSEFEGNKVIHAHIAVANSEGKVYGGHLMEGCIVDPTAELIIIEGENLLLRRFIDEKTKLKLLLT